MTQLVMDVAFRKGGTCQLLQDLKAYTCTQILM